VHLVLVCSDHATSQLPSEAPLDQRRDASQVSDAELADLQAYLASIGSAQRGGSDR
jgi:hypothetical protein